MRSSRRARGLVMILLLFPLDDERRRTFLRLVHHAGETGLVNTVLLWSGMAETPVRLLLTPILAQ